jgi:hypothetical protein
VYGLKCALERLGNTALSYNREAPFKEFSAVMRSQLIPVAALGLCDLEAMYRLLSQHFEQVTWQVFQTDLAGKNWVLLLEDEASQTLKGFSTLWLHQITLAGETVSVVYSGDTIIDPSAWSSAVLPRVWMRAVNLLHQHNAHQRLFWLLICSGFRTYRFLPLFWKTFYPRYDEETPTDMAALLTRLAQDYYGDRYQADTGIVRFDHPQVLRQGLIEIPAGRQSNPHIQFFQSQNPGYLHGDELVCLTEICYDNLTRAGQRMWQAESPLEWVQASAQL